MIINSKGAKPSTLDENLEYWTNELRTIFGDDFVIKKEGVIDNLATSTSLITMDEEEQLMFIIKNINPYTAEGEWQDQLYALIGLVRKYAEYTIVQRTVEGTPNTTVSAGSILFRNKSTDDQFKLNDDCQLDENGKGVGSFTAEELGTIDLPNEAICEIITAPTNVLGIYFTDGNIINIGQEYESDAEFRLRWIDNQSLANSDTTDGTRKYLLPLVESSKDIFIRQNRNVQKYSDVPLHSMNIVINSAYDDETIAKTILANFKDGVGYVGDIEVILQDSQGTDTEIQFSRAQIVNIDFKIVIALKENVSIQEVNNAVQATIKNNFKLAMGQDVIANKFIVFIDAINGVDFVKNISVSRDGVNFMAGVEISDVELAKVRNIDVSE